MFAATIFDVLLSLISSIILKLVYQLADFVNILISWFFGW